MHPSERPSSHFALVLPGAVARGAFEAGIVQVLAEREVKIDRIIATSSGTLNGIAFASGIRQGQPKQMADVLVDAWEKSGGWNSFFSADPLAWIRGRGLSSHDALLKLMRSVVKPCTSKERHDIELRMIVAPLDGVEGRIGNKPATTYEKMIHFAPSSFDSPGGLKAMFNVAAAACSFPGLFEPVEIEHLGPCVDGGAVNNAPIKYALDECGVNRVFMAIPFPAVMPRAKSLSRWGLINHLVEILINERLYRDLNSARNINSAAKKLEEMVHDGSLTAHQLEKIKSVMSIRKVEVTEIRPVHPFPGRPFSAFFDKNSRLRLIEAGRAAAISALSRIPAENPTGEQTTE